MNDNLFLLSMQGFYLHITFITKKREGTGIFFKLAYRIYIQMHRLEILKFYQLNNTVFL